MKDTRLFLSTAILTASLSVSAVIGYDQYDKYKGGDGFIPPLHEKVAQAEEVKEEPKEKTTESSEEEVFMARMLDEARIYEGAEKYREKLKKAIHMKVTDQEQLVLFYLKVLENESDMYEKILNDEYLGALMALNKKGIKLSDTERIEQEDISRGLKIMLRDLNKEDFIVEFDDMLNKAVVLIDYKEISYRYSSSKQPTLSKKIENGLIYNLGPHREGTIQEELTYLAGKINKNEIELSSIEKKLKDPKNKSKFTDLENRAFDLKQDLRNLYDLYFGVKTTEYRDKGFYKQETFNVYQKHLVTFNETKFGETLSKVVEESQNRNLKITYNTLTYVDEAVKFD